MTLPQGWAETTLGEVAELNMGQSPLGEHTNTDGVGIPLVGGASDLKDGKVVPTKHTTAPTKLSQADDIIFCVRATIGRWALSRMQICLGRGVAGITPLTDSRWLQYFLTWQGGEIDKAGVGSTFRQVDKATLLGWPTRMPPLAEQRRIVAKLDVLTARFARVRAEAVSAVALARRLREQVQASGAVAGAVLLEELLSAPLRNGLSIKGSDQAPGVPALRLSALREQTVNLGDVRYLDVPATRAETYRLKSGDVLVSRGNGTLRLVGRASRVAATPADLTIFPDTAFRIRLDPARASARWFTLVWNSPLIRTQIEARARTTAGIWKISQRDLNEIELPDVSLHEQLEWVEKVDAAFVRADRLEAEAKKALALIDRLEAAVLAKAFRGELVAQDPNDEPASVLLERIRARRAAEPKPGRGRKPRSAS